MAKKKIAKNRMKTFIKNGRRPQKKGGKKEEDQVKLLRHFQTTQEADFRYSTIF